MSSGRGIAAGAPRVAALATVLAVLFLTFLDTTIISVTLGDVQQDLGAGVISLQWVINGYSLVFASLMLVAGSFSDRLGRKPVMLAGIVVFCGGSLLAALAPNVGTLIAGRAVMGLGAAASEPGTLSVIRHLYADSRERAKAFGWWAAVSGLALAAGPVIGGLLVGADSWRGVFWFNLVFGLVILAGAARWVPNSADPQPGRLDLGGFVFGALALASIVFAVIEGEQHGFDASWVIALFTVGALALVAFVATERRADNPVLDLRYVKRPIVSSALFAAFAVYFGVFSIFFFTALYLDVVGGYSGWRLAGMYAPMAAAIVVGSLLTGAWVGRAGSRTPLVTGCVIAAGGVLFTNSFLTEDPSFAPLTAGLAIAGVGFGIAVVPLTSAVMSNVPTAHSSMAASATNTSRQLGAVIGVAALGALLNSHLTSGLSDRLHGLGITGGAQQVIIDAVESGGGSAGGIDLAHPPALLRPIVDAATSAFRAGLHQALLVAAILMLVAAAFTALTHRAADERAVGAVGPGGKEHVG